MCGFYWMQKYWVALCGVTLLLSLGASMDPTEAMQDFEAKNVAVVASCMHDVEFSKSVAFNLAKNVSYKVTFVTDSFCADSIKIPNVETFSESAWYNASQHTSGFLSGHSNFVQNQMNEIVRSAETLQRLLERQSVNLVFLDSYHSCAAAIAHMHDIPLVLLHNTGFPQPTSNLARFQLSFVPNFVYQLFPEFALKLLHEAYVVMFKNFPDIRMAISVGNKCNLDLKTNASYSSLLHFWASYPRTGPLSAPLIDYNRKTKHFTPLGLTDLVEKGKPKSNRLDNFLDPRKAPEELKNVDDFVYFSGERELMDSFGEDYFIKAFSNQFKFKTIWTNKSLTGFEVPPQILVTPLTTHSVVSSPKVSMVLGSCNVDNVMMSLYYEKPLLCFETSWRESGLVEALTDSAMGVSMWPLSTSVSSLQDNILHILDIKQHISTMIAKHKRVQTGKGNTPLEELAVKFLDHGTSTKKKVPDPVNHGIEFAIVLLTFLMLIRFFFRTGRKIFQNPKSTKQLQQQVRPCNKPKEEAKETQKDENAQARKSANGDDKKKKKKSETVPKGAKPKKDD